jgi:signal transduction histidine kinase
MGIAHEISSPLGVITGRAAMLGKSEDDKTQRSSKIISEQAEHIHTVIRAFLSLARGEAPTRQDLRAGDLVRAAVALVEHVYAKDDIELSASAGDTPLRGDRALLEQALVNLLLNAAQAGSTRVTVEARREDANLVFTVLDDGHGIPHEVLRRQAEPFFTTKPQGTGLGLAIVSEIAKNHSGRLTLEASTPRGTRARITLPATEPT